MFYLSRFILGFFLLFYIYLDIFYFVLIGLEFDVDIYLCNVEKFLDNSFINENDYVGCDEGGFFLIERKGEGGRW